MHKALPFVHRFTALGWSQSDCKPLGGSVPPWTATAGLVQQHRAGTQYLWTAKTTLSFENCKCVLFPTPWTRIFKEHERAESNEPNQNRKPKWIWLRSKDGQVVQMFAWDANPKTNINYSWPNRWGGSWREGVRVNVCAWSVERRRWVEEKGRPRAPAPLRLFPTSLLGWAPAPQFTPHPPGLHTPLGLQLLRVSSPPSTEFRSPLSQR